jgi:DNA-binding NarL/FixJ family response regulator
VKGCALPEKAPARVLVVEDDADVRRLLQRDLRDMGYEVHAVDSAREAIRLLSESSFAVVVSDIRMPETDGVELTRWIKESCPDTEVILVTGYASLETATSAVRLGAADYLLKPVDTMRELQVAVERAAGKHRQSLRQRGNMERRVSHEQLLSVLDHLPLGVFVTDGTGTVLQLNRKARAILNQQDGLRLGPGARLWPWPFPGEATPDAPYEPTGRAVTIPRRSGRAPLSLLLVSLDSGGLQDGNEPPRLALFVSDPEERGTTTDDILCRLYGLTKAEARVTQRLAQGHSVEEIADDLAVHRNTVRAHLKQAFQKTGTSRQAELVSLVLTGPACLAPDRDDSDSDSD